MHISSQRRWAISGRQNYSVSEIRELVNNAQTPITTRLWRLQDLHDGGLVYMLELFVSAIRSSKAASHHSSRALYIGHFRGITADWEELRHALWTQRLLLNLIRHVLSENDDSSPDEVPGYIIGKFQTFVLAE